MVDTTLTTLRSTNPLNTPITGDEVIETVVSSTSRCAIHKELAAAPINAQTGTSYTLQVADQGRVVTMSNASANSIVIPTDAAQAIPINAVIIVRQIGAGATSVDGDTGVTVQRRAALTTQLASQWSQIVLHKVAANTWHTTGEYLAS